MSGYTKDFEQSLAFKLFTGAVTVPEKPISKRSRKLGRKAMREQLEYERKLAARIDPTGIMNGD